MSLLAHWRDIPLTDPRVEAVVDALIQESKSLTDSPQTWRTAQIAVAALADHDQGAVGAIDAALELLDRDEFGTHPDDLRDLLLPFSSTRAGGQ
jgi:hypothetical protein